MSTNAWLIEQLGVSGYLGTAYLIQDPHILVTTTSILTTQSHYSTIMNMFQRAKVLRMDFPYRA